MNKARTSKSYKLTAVSEHGRDENVTFIHVNRFNSFRADFYKSRHEGPSAEVD